MCLAVQVSSTGQTEANKEYDSKLKLTPAFEITDFGLSFVRYPSESSGDNFSWLPYPNVPGNLSSFELKPADGDFEHRTPRNDVSLESLS